MRDGDGLHLCAAVGLLLLAALAFARGKASPLARPVAILTLDLAGIHLATLAAHVSGQAVWGRLDGIFTPLAPPLALHVIVSFVGTGKTRRRALAFAYAIFGALAALSFLSFAVPALRGIAGSRTWATVYLAAWAPLLVLSIVVVVRHLLQTTDLAEKARSRAMLGAIAVGGALASTDIARETGAPIPRLAPLGTLGAAALLAVAVFRLRLFDRDIARSTTLYAAAMGTSFLVANVVAYVALGQRLALLVVAVAGLALVAAAAGRELVTSLALARAETDRLVVMGRFAAQLAHDLKNPLAAAVGAAQVLEGTSLTDEQKEYLTLLGAQLERLRAVAESYDRLGKLEPVRATVDLVRIAERVAEGQRLATPGIAVDVRAASGPTLAWEGDGDLLERAVDNLVRNAAQATPVGGTITIEVAAEDGRARVEVRDSGEGMDPRHVQQAMQEFFTTRAAGTGLGLPFVRRVAHAHGGDVTVQSRLGRGTVVRMTLDRECSSEE